MLNIMNRVRLYHALLALLAISAYLTGEVFPAHAWLGYGVAAVIVLRLLWALGGERQVGLMRFYPDFEGLKLKGIATHPAISRTLMLGIALSLLTVTGTGIAIDQGRTLGLGRPAAERMAAPSSLELNYAEDDDEDEHEGRGRHEERGEGPLSEIHELAGNLFLPLVGLHVAYLLLFKRPLAKFMLFLPRGARRKQPPTSA
ncbi:MAG: cytochrome b/b6 domain-containing protein [Acidobacteria bacterium]|jgi:cytochrome b|nr:cytochrome b/b6 domain-containing protein [Acidobacteriota bacterium]